jgi:Holliday junction resolvase RusA-like endonuclease
MTLQPNKIAQATTTATTTTTTIPDATVSKPRRSASKKVNPKGTEMIPDTVETTQAVAEKEIKKRKKKRAKLSEREELYWRLDSDEVLFHPSDDDNNNDVINVSNAAAASAALSHEDSNTDVLKTPNAASWSLLRFTVRGNPVSLQRHRSTQNGRFSYNPSASAQEAFRNVVQDLLTNNRQKSTTTTTRRSLPTLLQPEDAALAVTLIFHRKRPLNHFLSSKRGPGRLKNTAPSFVGYSSSATVNSKRSDDDSGHDCSNSSNRKNVSIFQSDVDNLAKFVLDALNGFLYVDDKQIISLTAIKVWDNYDACLGSTSVCLRVLQDQHELEAFIMRQQQQQTII